MVDNTENVQKFFAAYEARTNKALSNPPEIDMEGNAAAYTEHMIEANPQAILYFKNDKEWRAAMPQAFEAQRSIGTKSMTIINLQVTGLDDFHSLAKVQWKAHYEKQDGSDLDIEFDEFYLVQTLEGTSKVFAWIAGDQEGILKAHGLLPDEA